MQDRLEKLIKVVYKKWKTERPTTQQTHPDEETLVCFLEGRLSQKENEQIKLHLISCEDCAEVFVIQARLKTTEEKAMPEDLLERMKDLVSLQDKTSILEIILKFKEKILELVSTSGDILVGQELVPAPVLRSRRTKDFKDEITILKDFKDIIVEAKIENKGGQVFDLTVVIKEKKTQKIIKDLRVTLLKDDVELESYLADSGKVTFEHILLGKYTIEIENLENKLVSILLDIKT